MTRSRLLQILALGFLILLVAAAGGAWWYFFGPSQIQAAELVPANTIVFATISDASAIVDGYQTSDLKKIVDSPNAKPLFDEIIQLAGQKNIDLFKDFLPNLSGQSFVAITHFDYDHPEKVGFIAAMKPKPGAGNLEEFAQKLKAAWPDLLKRAKIGTGSISGISYKWIEPPGASDRFCVTQHRGWIVVTWGEGSLQDWLERFHRRATTSNLSDDLDYRKSLTRTGDNPMTLVYVNYRQLSDVLQKQMRKTNPAAGNYLSRKFAAIGGGAIGTSFDNGEIVDHFSLLIPRDEQLDSGASVDPCPFDTLKFTGPDTRLYWAFSLNWKQYYKNLQQQPENLTSPPALPPPAPANPLASLLLTWLQNWTHGAGLDIENNIVGALGPEVSLQLDWSPDTAYPELGLFVKLDKPDDFKPVITAIIDQARKTYATSAVINEINSNGQNFATLKFVSALPISPTITENGPYLGIFLNENQAVRSFQRDPSIGLTHNADFNRQVGDRRKGASQVLFMDTPRLLDRAYRTAMPYLTLGAMFNKKLASALSGHDMPPDLAWLAPMGTWAYVVTEDGEGIHGYSRSGIGNQGIVLSLGAGVAAGAFQVMGLIPKPNWTPAMNLFPTPVTPAIPTPPGMLPTIGQTNAANPAALPAAVTNPAPSYLPAPVTNAEPAVTHSPASPDIATNPAPLTNSLPNATPPPPASTGNP